MCGISGIYSTKLTKEKAETYVARMVSAQRHRGPDDEGILSFENNSSIVALGHNRLSIIDISKAGHQPMIDSKNGNIIVFNGEIYNFECIKKELKEKGYVFYSKCDTEVILKAYSEWGVSCFKRLRGIFAFAIWDNENKHIVIARDHMGVKPLYYYYNNNSFYFASEVRTLLKGGVPSKLSKTGLNSLMSYGSVQEPYTLVEGIYSLRPGSYSIIKNDFQVNEIVYWEPDLSKPAVIDKNEAERNITMILEEATKLQMVSDVPLGAFLSGGIDSSAIVALMRRVNPDADIHTFSIIFDDPKYDEREYAKLVANKNRTRHSELLMTGDLIKSSLPEMINSYDQPSMDGMNSWCVSKLVKDSGITVALSGVGGDELFVGYGNFSKPRTIYQYANGLSHLPKAIGRTIEKYAWNEKVRKMGETVSFEYDPYFIGRRLFSDKQYANLIDEKGQVNIYSWLHNAYDSITNLDYTDDICRFSWYVQRSYMLSTLLRDTDQMSMAHSLEIRVPLIDYKLVEYVTPLPQEIKMNMHTPKQLLVKAAGDGIPDECIHRRKQGFEFPFDQFIKNELKDEIESFFIEDSHSVFNKQGLKSMWKQYKRGKIAWSRILLLYITDQWLRKYNVN